MALTIKNERACELAELEQRLEREKKPGGKKGSVEEIMALAHEVVADLDPKPVDDHGDFLYDEYGLPK